MLVMSTGAPITITVRAAGAAVPEAVPGAGVMGSFDETGAAFTLIALTSSNSGMSALRPNAGKEPSLRENTNCLRSRSDSFRLNENVESLLSSRLSESFESARVRLYRR